MNVQDLIDRLSVFDPRQEVKVTAFARVENPFGQGFDVELDLSIDTVRFKASAAVIEAVE